MCKNHLYQFRGLFFCNLYTRRVLVLNVRCKKKKKAFFDLYRIFYTPWCITRINIYII